MRIWKAVLPMSSFLLLSACGPVGSLSPLFNQEDVVFEDALVGTWMTVEDKKDETATWTFKKSGDNAYELIFPADEEGSTYKSEVHLVRLGKFLFLDAYPSALRSDEKKQNKAPLPFPLFGVHIFGRIWMEKDLVRIALLDEEWVKDMGQEKKLTLGYALADDDIVLTASTAELQELALQYAEDTKAFSFDVRLCRQSQVGINPNKAQTWDSLGRTYSEMGRDDEALAAFNKATQIDPSQSFDYSEKAVRALIKMSRYDQARKELQEATVGPFPEFSLFEIAFSYFVEGRFADAVSAFEKPSRRPDMVDAIIHNLALNHVGKQAEAEKLFGSMLGPSPRRNGSCCGWLICTISSPRNDSSPRSKPPSKNLRRTSLSGTSSFLRGTSRRRASISRKCWTRKSLILTNT